MSPLAFEDELGELAAALCDGELTAAQQARLEELLGPKAEAEGSQARQWFLQYILLHGELHWSAAHDLQKAPDALRSIVARNASEGGDVQPSGSGTEPIPARRKIPIVVRSAAAVAFHPVTLFSLVGLVAIGLLATLFWPEGPPAVVQRPTGPVATVRLTANAQWEAGFAPQGMALTQRERLKLQRGLAQIVFDSRATVIIEGPAELQITDRNACRLVQGKLTATVPHEAAGFMVHTPERTVTDLGTEFGVIVKSEVGSRKSEGELTPTSDLRPSTSTEVHVFNGKVDLGGSSAPQSTTRNPPSTILSAGSAVSIDAASGVQPIALDTQQFRRRMPFDLIADLRADYDRAATKFVASQSSDGKIADSIGSGSWNFYSSKTAAAGSAPTPLVYSTSAATPRNPNAFAQPGNSERGFDLPGISNSQLIENDVPPGSGDLSVHPGKENSDEPMLITRWTAGIVTSVRLAGHLYDAGLVQDGITLEIVLNGKTSIWKSQVTSGNSLLSFDLSQQVRPGDFIDFVVGPNIRFDADGSNLSVRIMPAASVVAPTVVKQAESSAPTSDSLVADLRTDYEQAAAKFADGQTSEGKIADASRTGTWNFFSSAGGDSHTPLMYTTRGRQGRKANAFAQTNFIGREGWDLPGVSNTMLIAQDAPPGAGELSLHPGSPSSPEPLLVARWTSGIAASANIRGAIHDVGGFSDGVTLQILLNGKRTIFDPHTTQGNTPVEFDLKQPVTPGDTIDFVVGPNASFDADSSNLRIRISR